MIRRSVGYTLVIIGLFILALGVKPIHDNAVVNFPFLSVIDPIILLGGGVVFLVIGVIIMRGSNRRQSPEVPIYEGEDVVGFRRMGKKKRR
jgi:multisubunit Na+/H+ antiporter MnhB subunit